MSAMSPREPAEIERLAQEVAWVRRLALAVVRDAHAADDLSQDAWVAALRRPPSGTRTAAGWFRHVVGNLARTRARGEAHRASRERAAAKPEREDDPARALERLEMHEALVRAVRELAEPYRTTVLLRWFAELEPREIARRTGVPVRTVHTRTSRALALLRDALDRRSHGDRRQWTSAWIPLLSKGLSKPAGHWPWIIAMNVKLKIAVAAGVAGILAGLWFFLPSPQETEFARDTAERAAAGRLAGSGTESSPQAVPGRIAIAPPPSVTRPAATPAATRLATDPCAGDLRAFERMVPPGALEGIVVGNTRLLREGFAWLRPNGPPGSPRARYEETLSAEGDERASIGSNGVFRFDGVAAGEYCLGIESRRGMARTRSCRVTEGHPTPRVVFALGYAQVRGTVYDETGQPVADARIEVLPQRMPNTASGAARTGSDGRYALSGLCAGTHAIVANVVEAEMDPRNKGFLVDLAPDETKVLDFGSPRSFPVWSGRLLSPDGTPLGVDPCHFGLRHRATGTIECLRVQPDGTFRNAIRPGEYDVLQMSGPVILRQVDEASMPEHDLVRDVTLPPTWLAVTVRYVGRQPEPHKALAFLTVSIRRRATLEWVAGSTRLGPEGRGYHFFCVPPGEYDLWASPSPVSDGRGEAHPVTIGRNDREVQIEIAVSDM